MNTTLLLPTSSTDRSILARLSESLAQATAVRACIAFWTLPPAYLPDNFYALLGESDSFCCVDVHWPTNFRVLADYHQLGARHFYVLCKELYETGQLRARRHLLHTKMLVLDLPDGQAEVWVGSHNFTQYALEGINWEASVVLSCPQDSPTYRQARAYVEAIRDTAGCLPFDPTRVAEYEALQRSSQEQAGTGSLVEVLPLVGHQVLNLRNQTLLLLGDNVRELTQFGQAEMRGATLCVLAGDLTTGRSHLLAATVQSSGRIDEWDARSYGIDFSARPYALRQQGLIPYAAFRSQALGGEQLKPFRCWLNLRLGDVVGDQWSLQPVKGPAPAQWQPEPAASAEVQAALRRGARQARERLAGLRERRPVSRPLVAGTVPHEATVPAPLVRVARPATLSAPAEAAPARSLLAAFEPATLAAAQALYDQHFQKRYFAEGSPARPGLPEAIAVPANLKALQQRTLLHRRRLG